jgi:hypothetical protein
LKADETGAATSKGQAGRTAAPNRRRLKLKHRKAHKTAVSTGHRPLTWT